MISNIPENRRPSVTVTTASYNYNLYEQYFAITCRQSIHLDIFGILKGRNSAFSPNLEKMLAPPGSSWAPTPHVLLQLRVLSTLKIQFIMRTRFWNTLPTQLSCRPLLGTGRCYEASLESSPLQAEHTQLSQCVCTAEVLHPLSIFVTLL